MVQLDRGTFGLLVLTPPPSTTCTPRGSIAPRSSFASESTTRSTGRATLNSLSNEVLRLVFDKLRVKHHQLSLCKVNRKTYNLLLPRLYEHICIDLSQYPYSLQHLHALLSEENPGLQHVRTLEFVLGNSACTSVPAGVQNCAQLFITSIPEDQLLRFIWPSKLTLHPFYSRTLWERQSKLRNIELYDLSWQVDEVKVTKAIRALEELHELRISPDGPAGLRYAHLILKNRPITSLHLDLRTLRPPMRNGERNPNNGLVRDGLTEILFHHLLPLESLEAPPLNLTRLTLWSVNLYFCVSTLLRTFHPTHLKHLELVRCTYAGLFLHVMTTLKVPITLESLVIADFHTGTPDYVIVRGINSCLGASTVGCLKHLWLRLRGHAALPDPTAIGRHGSSLERLSLDVCTPRGLPDPVILRYRTQHISQILAHATPRLRQLRLGCSYSVASALAALSADEFDTSVTSHLIEIWRYADPVTLDLTGVWDQSIDHQLNLVNEQQGFRSAWAVNAFLSELVIRELAQAIFHEADEYSRVHHGSRRARLRVLAFGTSASTDSNLAQPLCCVRATTNVLHDVRETAVTFGLDALVKAGEEVDILISEALDVEHRI